MHDIKSNFDKVYQTIKSPDLPDFDAQGNVTRPDRSLLFTDIEILSLVITARYMSLDSENWLFRKINSDYKHDFPLRIDRIGYHRRKRQLFPFPEKFVKVWLIVFWNLKTTLSSIPCLGKSVKLQGRNVLVFAERILERRLTKDSVLHRIFTSMAANFRESAQ